MSKFFLCPELVIHSKESTEYWLHILLKVLQKDHIKIIVDKDPNEEKQLKSKLIKEYFKIARDNINIQTWVVDLVNRKEKNLKTIKLALPIASDLKEDIITLATNLNIGKKTILCKTEDDYEDYFELANANSIHFIDKDEAIELLKSQNEQEININIDKIINRRGIINIGDGNENSIN